MSEELKPLLRDAFEAARERVAYNTYENVPSNPRFDVPSSGGVFIPGLKYLWSNFNSWYDSLESRPDPLAEKIEEIEKLQAECVIQQTREQEDSLDYRYICAYTDAVHRCLAILRGEK